MASSSNNQRASRMASFLSSPPKPLNAPFGSGGRVQEYASGTLMEVLRDDDVVLMLMEQEGTRVVRSLKQGKFVMKVILHAITTIVMAACIVDDLHWPLARDAPVVRVARRSFLIAMPGLIYALWFPPTIGQRSMTRLGELFGRFCHYEDFNYVANEIDVSEDQPGFWPWALERMQPILQARLQQYSHITEPPSPTSVGCQSSELLRATRMSEAVKLVMKAILTGVLRTTDYRIHDPNPHLENGGAVIEGTESYPTLVMFKNIIEAQQFLSAVANNEFDLQGQHQLSSMGLHPSHLKVWSLNRTGLVRLLRIIVLAGEMPMGPNGED